MTLGAFGPHGCPKPPPDRPAPSPLVLTLPARALGLSSLPGRRADEPERQLDEECPPCHSSGVLEPEVGRGAVPLMGGWRADLGALGDGQMPPSSPRCPHAVWGSWAGPHLQRGADRSEASDVGAGCRPAGSAAWPGAGRRRSPPL